MFSWWKELWQTATLEQATLVTGLLTLAGGLLAFLGVIATILVTARHSKRALAEERRRETDRIKRETLLEAAESVVAIQHALLDAQHQIASQDQDEQDAARTRVQGTLGKLDLAATKLLMFDFEDASDAVSRLDMVVFRWSIDPGKYDDEVLPAHINSAQESIKASLGAHA